MNTRLRIERVGNGYIIKKHAGEGEVDVSVAEEMECADFELEELETMRRVLWDVIEYFGMGGSDHDHYRLRVAIDDQREGKEVE